MNVAVVDADLPYPPTSGKRLRTLNLLLPLAKRHRVTYLCRRQSAHEDPATAMDYLRSHGVTPVVVDHTVAAKTGVGFAARLAGNLLSPLPYSVASHVSRPLAEAVEAHAAAHRVDLWQFEWTGYLSALGPQHKAPRVVVAPNVESLLWQRYHEAERRPLRRWYIREQWRKYERFERHAFRTADRVVAVTDEDAALMRDRFGAPDNVVVVDNGVDLAYFAQVERRPEPGRVLFLGSLDWRPNLDAVAVLLDAIFPAVRRAWPDACLDVVGRSPPAWLRDKVAAQPGVELHADVPDVRPHLARASVLAVPLRIGGGSRLKILEALAANVPVVSTRVGAEGLRLQPGRDLEVVDEAGAMAATLIDGMRNPGRFARMAENGRAAVRQRYDWASLAAKLEQVWLGCAGAVPREAAA